MDIKELRPIVESWEGTPYHHQAKLKGVGVDCCNFIAAIGEELGLVEDIKLPPYNLQWHLHSKEEKMLKLLEEYGCIPVVRDPVAGDILCFKYGRAHSHLGIYLEDNYLAHAAIDYGKVIIQEITEDMINRLGAIYKYPDKRQI